MSVARGGMQNVVKGQRFRALARGGTTLRVVSAAAIAWALTAAINPAAAQSKMPCRYEVAHVIQGPICPITQAPAVIIGTAISPSGRYVCGYYRLCGPSQNRAFFYDTTTQQFTTLPYAESPFTSANDVNEEYVVGQADGLGFLFHIATGQTTLLHPPVPPEVGTCSVNAINSSNVVCGTRTVDGTTQKTTAFRWSAQNGFEDLGLINGEGTSAADLNDAGVVTGKMGAGNSTRPFLWNGTNWIDLGSLAGLETVPTAINNNQQVVGASVVQTSPTVARAFLWSNGSMNALPLVQGFTGAGAGDLNDGPIIIGLCNGGPSGITTPFVWTGGSTVALFDLVKPKAQFTIKRALAVSTDGSLTGDATYIGATVAYMLRPIRASIADLNKDCEVGVPDLLILIAEWGNSKSLADINGNGIVDAADILLMIEQWSRANRR